MTDTPVTAEQLDRLRCPVPGQLATDGRPADEWALVLSDAVDLDDLPAREKR